MRWRSSRNITAHAVAGVALAVLLSAPLRTAAAPTDDAYVAGYVAAVLERQLNVSVSSVRVEGGVVTIDAGDLPHADRLKIITALTGLRGVTRIDIVKGPAPAQQAATAEPAGPRVALSVSDPQRQDL